MRTPFLMMRTRGLQGPFFARNVGNRSSRPLAHTQGNAISATIVEPVENQVVTHLGTNVTHLGEEVTHG